MTQFLGSQRSVRSAPCPIQTSYVRTSLQKDRRKTHGKVLELQICVRGGKSQRVWCMGREERPVQAGARGDHGTAHTESKKQDALRWGFRVKASWPLWCLTEVISGKLFCFHWMFIAPPGSGGQPREQAPRAVRVTGGHHAVLRILSLRLPACSLSPSLNQTCAFKVFLPLRWFIFYKAPIVKRPSPWHASAFQSVPKQVWILDEPRVDGQKGIPAAPANWPAG